MFSAFRSNRAKYYLIGSGNIMLFWLAIYLFALTFSLATFLYLAITGIIAFLKKCRVEKKRENMSILDNCRITLARTK
jgi:hypothetical protein